MTEATEVVLDEVYDERQQQDQRWGEQNHPDRQGGVWDHAVRADWWKRENALRVKTDEIAWDGILLEEVYEALSETDPLLLRAELVQVAAVAAAWAEAIDRRLARAAAAA